MCSTRNAWIGGSRRAAIIVPHAALRCDVFSLFIINERPLLNLISFLRAYLPHHRRSLSHPRRKAIAQTVGIGSLMEREHLKPSHHITPDMDVQLFEMSFGSLVVVLLFFSFPFLFTSESELFWVSFFVFPVFSTCLIELSF